jgi:putative restriction endonuclease
MKFWVGVTDISWFRFHAGRQKDLNSDGNSALEVNFWQPSGRAPFAHLEENSPFLFKAKAPINKIVGLGFFTAFHKMSVDSAWELFGAANGTDNQLQMSRLIRSLVTAERKSDRHLEIGCTILSDCHFFDENDWIDAPEDWKSNIVTGKYYDSQNNIGGRLWDTIQMRLLDRLSLKRLWEETHEVSDQPLFTMRPTKVRLGQGGFRLKVTEAYGRRCALTGESTLPVLEAAHILPISEAGPNDVENGLLLRSDFHKLFDLGMVGVTPDYRIKISPAIREAFFNGKAYYRLDNQMVHHLPQEDSQRPNREFLEWHQSHVFRG